MVIRALIALGLGWVLTEGGRGARAADEPLEAPGEVKPCQVAYDPRGTSGTVLLVWTNTESYEAVELSLDGEPAPGEIDGTFSAARLEATPGSHSFGVRGIVGQRVSAWTTSTFTVLAQSPLLHPIENLDCELLPGNGGSLRLKWILGADAWMSGRLEVAGDDHWVDIPAGATSAVIELSPNSAGSPLGDGPRIAILTFKNADGYFSPLYTPLCLARTPAFRRGDCDSSGSINITDPIVALSHLFLGGRRWSCDDACDANDDGSVNIADPITMLSYLFQGGDQPPAPGPRTCGIDSTPDLLGGTCTCK